MINDDRVLASGQGRALRIEADGGLYVGRGRTLFRSGDGGRSWRLDARIPGGERDPRTWSRIGRRLFREYFQALEILGDGSRVVVARHGLYRADAGSAELRETFRIRRGSRPLGLARDDEDRLVFGEYGSNPDRREVHLYASVDRGRSFEVCHTFPSGGIRHVHGVVADARVGGFWVFTGDVANEAGIGILDGDLETFTWVVRGKQTARVVQAIRTPEGFVYGTDSEVEANAIVRLDVQSGSVERLREVEGSSLFAGRFGELGLISTCVEPSAVNRSRDVVLYASHDLAEWTPVLRRRKDAWPSLFQFGTFVLAASRDERPRALLSGQATAGLDDRFLFVDLSADAASR